MNWWKDITKTWEKSKLQCIQDPAKCVGEKESKAHKRTDKLGIRAASVSLEVDTASHVHAGGSVESLFSFGCYYCWIGIGQESDVLQTRVHEASAAHTQVFILWVVWLLILPRLPSIVLRVWLFQQESVPQGLGVHGCSHSILITLSC